LSPKEAVKTLGRKAAFIVTIWNCIKGHPLDAVKEQLYLYGKPKVVSFLPLYWKYSTLFLPYFGLDRPSKVLRARGLILAAASLITDKQSRIVFFKNIRARFLAELESMPRPVPRTAQFRAIFIKKNNKEVFIDAGAYEGDTLKTILETTPFYFEQYIAIEPDPKNFERLKKYVGGLEFKKQKKIACLQYAISDKNSWVYLVGSGTEQARICREGLILVKSRTIDKCIKREKVTFIKMDIEGAEPQALVGAHQTIKRKKPILAISIYHKINHLWSILLQIHKLNDHYAFFLRPHAAGGWDLILYAVPFDRLVKDNIN
jgi:FkbM family methyltransferase